MIGSKTMFMALVALGLATDQVRLEIHDPQTGRRNHGRVRNRFGGRRVHIRQSRQNGRQDGSGVGTGIELAL